MRKVTLKLSVAIAAFLIGITGTAFYFIYPTISFKAEGGGTPPAQNDNGKNDQLIKIVVTGRVVDNVGRPIQGAKVHASLGLDLEGTMVETDAAGRFVAESSSPFWFKEKCRPSVQAYAENYTWEWVHFDCSDWDKGERQFEQTIVLKPKAVNTELEKNRRLWQEKKIADYNLTASLYKGGEYRWAEPVLIKVRNAVAISIEPLNEKDKEIPVEKGIGGYRELDTIAKIFDYIQKGLDEEAIVDVKYDKNYGYPKEMQVDYPKKGWDHWQRMIIRKFEIITKE
jgi:hypothetical protein